MLRCLCVCCVLCEEVCSGVDWVWVWNIVIDVISRRVTRRVWCLGVWICFWVCCWWVWWCYMMIVLGVWCCFCDVLSKILWCSWTRRAFRASDSVRWAWVCNNWCEGLCVLIVVFRVVWFMGCFFCILWLLGDWWEFDLIFCWSLTRFSAIIRRSKMCLVCECYL